MLELSGVVEMVRRGIGFTAYFETEPRELYDRVDVNRRGRDPISLHRLYTTGPVHIDCAMNGIPGRFNVVALERVKDDSFDFDLSNYMIGVAVH